MFRGLSLSIKASRLTVESPLLLHLQDAHLVPAQVLSELLYVLACVVALAGLHFRSQQYPLRHPLPHPPLCRLN